MVPSNVLPLWLIDTSGVPLPHGWVGTTNQWAQGLGIGFAVLNLILLAIAWSRHRRLGVSAGLRELLLVCLALLPLMIVFFGYSYGMEASKSVEACGSCHVMDHHVADLRNPKSDSLAATHFKNRYIQADHCYTCHSDYGMSGTLKAKWEGLGHVVRNATGRYPLPLKIARPYPNWRCLGCHGASAKFRASEGHPPEDLPKLLSGETSCLECHGPAHAPQEKVARYEP